ncbi:hybrid sensor histidine kinase/response regulator [Maridesulfovibrio frigidus]|uniref:hybrid sensor histidine kinase/response regulator n=1 Tax=Maridesulfovibrio frigidus TaxID=340956 RepID=UPI0004E0EC51|nr:hybrid sensor histidine kinase/response regulator [Maridesulfovibrio frigidus]
MKIFSKWGLAAGFTSLICIFAAVIIVSSSLTFRKTLTGLSHNIMENIAFYTLDKSEAYLRPAEKAAELTTFLADSNIVSSEDPYSMISYFYQQIELYPQFTAIYYGNTEGEFFMASRSNSLVKNGYFTKIIRKTKESQKVELLWENSEHKTLEKKFDPGHKYDPRTRPWFASAVRSNEVIWTDPYVFFTAQKPGITTACPVYDKAGALQGVVGVDITIDELSIFLEKLKIGESGKAFIANRNGDVVAFPDLSKVQGIVGEDNKVSLSKMSELDDEVSRKAYNSMPSGKLSSTPVYTSFSHNGENYNSMFVPFTDPRWPWVIGIYVREDDFLGDVIANRNQNILISLFVVLFAGLAGLIVAKRIEKSRKEAVAATNAKSQFLASMSHEIRTPMSVILGTSDLLQGTELSEEQLELVSLLVNAGDGLLSLINDILDMSKVESGLLELENIDFCLSEAVQQTAKVFEVAASHKGIEVVCNISSDVPSYVKGDPGRLRQILINLIGNSLKFTVSGGIYIDVKLLSDTSSVKKHIEFVVRDTGPGMQKEVVETIFDSFVQADSSVARKHGGTGLGLAISKSLSNMMGGDIYARSELGKGSSFIVDAYFEKSKTVFECAKENCEVAEKDVEVRPLTILLVEDSEDNQLLFQHYTKKSPHKVEIAENGKVGVEMFKAIRPDIVFMDIEMPVMDGYEATRQIRQWEHDCQASPTAIVALSAHALKGVEDSVRAAGCTGYVTKPFSKKKLMQEIQNVFQA